MKLNRAYTGLLKEKNMGLLGRDAQTYLQFTPATELNTLPKQALDPGLAVDFPAGHFVHVKLDSAMLVYPIGHLTQSFDSYLYPLGHFTVMKNMIFFNTIWISFHHMQNLVIGRENNGQTIDALPKQYRKR